MMKSLRRIALVGFLVCNFGFSAQSFAQESRAQEEVRLGADCVVGGDVDSVVGQRSQNL